MSKGGSEFAFRVLYTSKSSPSTSYLAVSPFISWFDAKVGPSIIFSDVSSIRLFLLGESIYRKVTRSLLPFIELNLILPETLLSFSSSSSTYIWRNFLAFMKCLISKGYSPQKTSLEPFFSTICSVPHSRKEGTRKVRIYYFHFNWFPLATVMGLVSMVSSPMMIFPVKVCPWTFFYRKAEFIFIASSS